jgi:hypothetical protein
MHKNSDFTEIIFVFINLHDGFRCTAIMTILTTGAAETQV